MEIFSLIDIVNKLLIISKIEQGVLKTKPIETDMEGIIKTAISELEADGFKRAITMELSIEPETPKKILVDPTRLKDVMENLLSNAIKYSKSDSKIMVNVKKSNHEIDVAVTDTGIGIPEKEQKKIFSKFFRVPNAVLADQNGSGLGLFIVKSYVDGWGGVVTFTSKENVGTTFGFTIPLV